LALWPSAAAARRPIITGGGGVAFWSAAAAFGGGNEPIFKHRPIFPFLADRQQRVKIGELV